ncbi:ABC transporter substrate-binding protein [Micromonospora sp. BRA006-A]|nr:ABC transporter substrate-binding protein [Micromonospora sp. BRA006-A]
MRVSKRASGALAVGAAFALVASGCSSGNNDGGDAGASKDGAIVIDGTQPENPLVPANTTETGGGKIIDWVWSGLVEYPNNGGAPQNLLAESIDTSDSKVFKIKIKQNTKFHDGTTVKAESFVKAWNWAAYGPNGAQNASFFSDIRASTRSTPRTRTAGGPKKAPEPKAKEMSGLEGRRRLELRGHALRADRRVPDQAGLQRLHAAAGRVLLVHPGRLRQEADR